MTIHHLAEWFSWQESVISCEIGYSSDCGWRERIRSSSRGRCIVPVSLDIPRHLKSVDRVMRVLPARHWDVLEQKYGITATEGEKARALSCSRETYRVRVLCAEEWVNGFMSRI